MKKFLAQFSKEEKASWGLFITVFIVYAVISMVKSAYSASIAPIIAEGMFDKSRAGIINGGFYLFYGLAQLVGVKFVDKISPTKMVTISLLGTLISVVGMAVAKSFLAMLIIWSFCGLIQFAIWPAVLRIITEYILPEHQSRAKIIISFSYCVGMLMNYLSAAIVLGVGRWPLLFWVAAVILLLSAVLWFKTVKSTTSVLGNNKTLPIQQTTKNETTKATQSFTKILMASGLLFLMVSNFVRSAMDLGIKAWVPTMITENYSVSASFASVLTTVLVFINLSGVFIAGQIYPKRAKNLATAYGMCFLISLPFTALMLFTGRMHLLLVVLMLTVVTTMMYAGHQFINVNIPSCFVKFNCAGRVAAIVNAIASFGIVAANIGFGYLAEHFGWGVTIWSWVIIDAIAVVCCMCASPLWKKFMKE